MFSWWPLPPNNEMQERKQPLPRAFTDLCYTNEYDTGSWEWVTGIHESRILHARFWGRKLILEKRSAHPVDGDEEMPVEYEFLNIQGLGSRKILVRQDYKEVYEALERCFTTSKRACVVIVGQSGIGGIDTSFYFSSPKCKWSPREEHMGLLCSHSEDVIGASLYLVLRGQILPVLGWWSPGVESLFSQLQATNPHICG